MEVRKVVVVGQSEKLFERDGTRGKRRDLCYYFAWQLSSKASAFVVVKAICRLAGISPLAPSFVENVEADLRHSIHVRLDPGSKWTILVSRLIIRDDSQLQR